MRGSPTRGRCGSLVREQVSLDGPENPARNGRTLRAKRRNIRLLPLGKKGSAYRVANTTTEIRECDQSSKKFDVCAGSIPIRARTIHSRSGTKAPVSSAHRGASGVLALMARAAAKCGAYISLTLRSARENASKTAKARGLRTGEVQPSLRWYS